MQENEKTMGFVLAASDPWWVGDPFICHQEIPSQMWGHFLPGKRYSLAFSNHQIGILRDSHKLPQPKAAEPDLWDPATSFWPTKGCQKCVSHWGCWMDLVAEVMIYPMCTTSLWRAVVLATLIQGLIVAGWQATWLTYKKLRHNNSRYPR